MQTSDERGSPGISTPPHHFPGRSETDVAPAVEAAAVRHLYRHAYTAALSNIAMAIFVPLALSLEGGVTGLYAWAGLLLLLNAGRLVLAALYWRLAEPDHRRWSRYYLGPYTLTALLWGLAVPLFALRLDPVGQLVLLIVVAGIAAGSLPMNAAVLRNYYVYLVATLVPIIVTYFWHGLFGGGSLQHVTISIAALLYGLAMVFTGRTHNRDQRRAWEVTAYLDQANRELQERASHDALTGLWNRERFELALDSEFDRAERYGGEFSLVMIDIDHFKRINDQHGHDAGDAVLGELAGILRRSLRGSDQGARWGGEEFMLLLPHTRAEAAYQLAERLRATVADTAFSRVGRATISAGVAGFEPGEERAELLKRVDSALYAAKQHGRNRVEPAHGGEGARRAAPAGAARAGASD